VKEVLAKLHDQGKGTGPREEVGQVLYMRGLISAMLATEGMRVAQAKYGKGKRITGEQMRWGLENMNLTTIGLASLGFSGVMRTTSTSCNDHMGASWARIQTWDGKGWKVGNTWYEGDRKVLGPMVTETANKYAADKKLTRRPASDCNS